MRLIITPGSGAIITDGGADSDGAGERFELASTTTFYDVGKRSPRANIPHPQPAFDRIFRTLE